MTINDQIKKAFSDAGLTDKIKTILAKFNVEPVVAPVVAAPVALSTETLSDGTVLSYDGELAVGTVVNVIAADGSSVAAPDGDVLLVNGNTLVMVGGMVTEIKVAEVAAEPSVPAVSEAMATAFAALESKVKAIETKFSNLIVENAQTKEALKVSLSAIELISKIEIGATSTPATKDFDSMTNFEQLKFNRGK